MSGNEKVFGFMRTDKYTIEVSAKSKKEAEQITQEEDWCLNDGEYLGSDFEALEEE